MSVGLDKSASGDRYCPTCEQTFDAGDRCPTDGTRLVRLTKQADALIGRELEGRYTIVEKIGGGGMGTVYRATQHGLGREVAIKVVRPSLVSEPVVIKRFLREAKLASRLSHPNAVAVLDFGQTEDGLFYLVMELVKGRTLDRVIAEGALSPVRVVKIGSQICDALEGAHALQIIHRDLKPSNVFLMAASRELVKVLDFGLAKSLSPDASSATMTNAGALVGTPAFISPESVTGGVVDARSDLYSLGCILYTALTGKLPFQSTSVPELIAMHAVEPVPPLVGVPVGLAQVVERLLAKQPSARYPDAAATREALEAALATAEPERADPTLISTPSPTVLGWANQSQSKTTAAVSQAKATAAVTRAQVTTPSIQPLPSPASLVSRTPVDDDVMSSSPTILAPPRGKPMRPAPRSRRGLWLGLVPVVAGIAAFSYVMLAHDTPQQPAPSPSPARPIASPPPAVDAAVAIDAASAPVETPPPPAQTPPPARNPPTRPKHPRPSAQPTPPVRLNPGLGGN